MDGYAVVAADTKGASKSNPVSLKIVGEIPAGKSLDRTINSGECARIFTGSPVPVGANAVVMQEDTETDGESVRILDQARPFENIRLLGEDVKIGNTVAKAGESINAGLLNLMGATGHGTVIVNQVPKVGIVATGSELKERGQQLQAGEIHESNRVMISALVAETGTAAIVYPLVEDSLPATVEAFKKAFAECDVVITSGGVSVGDHDFVKPAFTELGGSLDLWRVRIKPGKPFAFGKCRDGFLFGLPGNPISAFATFMVLVRPALLHWQGASETNLPMQTGTLSEPITNRGDRRHFVRVRIDEEGKVSSAGTQASHMLHSLAKANGLLDVAPETTLAEGTQVYVARFG